MSQPAPIPEIIVAADRRTGRDFNQRIAPRGFTLIELLVVVSIIAMLIAILLPGLARTRQLTRRTVCSSNQHQFVAAAAMYTSDWKRRWPAGVRGDGIWHSEWLGNEAYLAFNPYAGNRLGSAGLICPGFMDLGVKPGPPYYAAETYYNCWMLSYNYLGGAIPQPKWIPGWLRTVTPWTSPLTVTDGNSATALLTDNGLASYNWGSNVMHTPQGGGSSPSNLSPAQQGGEVQIVGYTDCHVQIKSTSDLLEYSVTSQDGATYGITSFW
jgi:prepilin-type N-terminal cleavage/methylation domain-containing protein